MPQICDLSPFTEQLVARLRHFGGTLAAQSGATLKELEGGRLGQSTIRAALIYQHSAEDRDKAIAERMSAGFEAPSDAVALVGKASLQGCKPIVNPSDSWPSMIRRPA